MTDTIDRVAVHTDISDLFFNTDHENATLYEANGNRREFAGYDEGVLRDEAQMMLNSLHTLGVPDLPSAEDVAADYLARF